MRGGRIGGGCVRMGVRGEGVNGRVGGKGGKREREGRGEARSGKGGEQAIQESLDEEDAR